jgi:hypothetical protein
MAEKRKYTRLQKRLKLRYGAGSATSLAFTEDFSALGIFIRAVNVMTPGSTLLVELFMPDNEPVNFEARVMWSRRVPGSLIHLSKSGMGVLITRFLTGEEKYRELCHSLTNKKKQPPGIPPIPPTGSSVPQP